MLCIRLQDGIDRPSMIGSWLVFPETLSKALRPIDVRLYGIFYCTYSKTPLTLTLTFTLHDIGWLIEA